jgi:hypothetical protein
MSVPELSEAPPIKNSNTSRAVFNGGEVEITSAADMLGTIDITAAIKHPEGFHGSTQVHDLVKFGGAMVHLIGEHQDGDGFFKDKSTLPERGIIILSDHVDAASRLVVDIDGLAQKLNENKNLYDDPKFASEYYDAARQGYDLLAKHLPEFGELGNTRGIPLSLERAGLVTTRMAAGAEPDASIPGEVRVVTKRAHPIEGLNTDLMVSVKWRNLDDINRLRAQIIDVADFVNPASWASTAAALESAGLRGAVPKTVVHRSVMATDQGIAFSSRVLEQKGIGAYFYCVGTSYTLSDAYYLENTAVGDAGHILRHFLPSWAVEKDIADS